MNLQKGKYILQIHSMSTSQIKVSFKPEHLWLDSIVVSAINAKWPASDKSNRPKRMQALKEVVRFRTRGWTKYHSVDEIRQHFAKKFGLDLPL